METQDKKVYLDINYAFGSNFNGQSHTEVGIIEEDSKLKVVYSVGKAIVKQSISTGQMDFIKLSDGVESVECMAISSSRNHVAVCEKIKGENFLLLNLYGLKKRDQEIKHFKLPQTEKQTSFKIIAFSPSQPKFACCMTAEPDCQLMYLDIARSRGLAVSNCSVEGTDSITICPTQSHLICCGGRNVFRIFKVEDYAFKPYEDVKKLPKARNFTAHAWFDKTKILIGTDRGELFMVGPIGNNFEVKRHLANIFGEGQKNSALTSICVFSRGFILGSSQGEFSLWMKKEENQENFQDEYAGQLISRWQVEDSRISAVVHMAMCPLEETIAIAFSNGSIAIASLSHVSATDSDQKTFESDVLRYIYDGRYSSQISSMDICLQRPIFATLSKRESTIKLWNYKDPCLELTKKFDSKVDGIDETSGELIHCLALHPLGYYMAVGCCDKLRIYHILESELRNFREIVLRGACQLKFSNGGQYLAAAYPRQRSTVHKHNIHLINVYNSYTLEEVGRLSDHSNMITELFWRLDDMCLYSVGADGTAIQWRQEKTETKEWGCRKWTQPNSKYATVIYEGMAKTLIFAGVESGKSIIRSIKVEKDQFQKFFTMNFRVSRMHWLTSQWNVPAVLVGTEDGSLKVFNSPFDNIVEQTLNLHTKEITGIVRSPCGRYLISAGREGTIFIFQVSLTNKEGFIQKRLHDQVSELVINPLVGVLDEELADVVLVQRNDLNERQRYAKLLEKNLEEMKNKLVMQDDDENRKYQTELRALTDKKQKQIQKLKEQFERQKIEEQNLTIQTKKVFMDMSQRNEKAIEDLEVLYEKKMVLQSQKYYDLEAVFGQTKKSQDHDRQVSIKKSDETIEMFKREFVQCFRKAERVHNGQQEAVANGEKDFNEKVAQMEDEHEGELKKLSKEINELESQKTRRSAEYLASIELLRRECRVLDEQIHQYTLQNDEKRKQEEGLRNELRNVSGRIGEQRQQLEEKQVILKLREEKIGECQERIVDLQKKKEVLSYRTWEMRQQIEPKEDQIGFLKQEIYSLEQEFQKLLNDQKVMKEAEAQLKKQKEFLSVCLAQQKISTRQKKAKVRKICDEIDGIVQSKSSQRKFYEMEMKQLYEKYSQVIAHKHITQNPRGLDEMQRHARHIDQSIVDVNKATQSNIRQRDEQIQKTTREKVDLIKKVTELREEKAELMNELRNVQKMIDSLKRQIIDIKVLCAPPEKQEPRKMEVKTNAMVRATSQPAIKGKIAKGINYDIGSLSIFMKVKLKDLEGKMDVVRDRVRKKESTALKLQNRIKEHAGRCADEALTKWISEYEG